MRDTVFVCCAAVTCQPPEVSYVVSSADTSVGAVVVVSCPDGENFTDQGIGNNLTTTCLANGNWYPVIPDCEGIGVLLHSSN
jgi:Sushi repeat (SCR repeat)/Hormone receptor domain